MPKAFIPQLEKRLLNLSKMFSFRREKKKKKGNLKEKKKRTNAAYGEFKLTELDYIG